MEDLSLSPEEYIAGVYAYIPVALSVLAHFSQGKAVLPDSAYVLNGKGEIDSITFPEELNEPIFATALQLYENARN
ncbi:MAG TPA: hypothetical protein VHL10_07130 [Nitrososphaera sp.]|jgi:hypothetical protein|nr:hypothetical protein [Nitrososphaera sp.]